MTCGDCHNQIGRAGIRVPTWRTGTHVTVHVCSNCARTRGYNLAAARRAGPRRHG